MSKSLHRWIHRHADRTERRLHAGCQREYVSVSLVPVGEFTFKAGNSGSVDLTNRDTDGRIAIDAVRWVWLGDSEN